MRKDPPMSPDSVARLVELMETSDARFPPTADPVPKGWPHLVPRSLEAESYQASRHELRATCIEINERQQWQETVARYMTFRKERRTHYGEEI